MTHFGVVLFNDVILKRGKDRKRLPTEGWASIDGGPSRRIGSITELESNVKWLTNLDFVDFFSNQLGKNPNLFYSAFLRTDLKSVADDIGAGVEQLSTDKAVCALSMIFQRIMNLAVNRLQINLNSRNVNTLYDFIAARTTNTYKIPDEINEALKHAYQATTQCVTRFNREWKYAMLRKPRYQHAIDVLSTPVPSEFRWVYINNDRMPVSNIKRVDWCLAHDLPVLANVKVTPRRGGELNGIISYNSGAMVERAWLCQPELLWMSLFCDIEVIGAFVCEAGFDHQKEIDTFPTLGDFSHASYTLGLLVENLWVSMASARSNLVGQKFYPPRAVWYRAVDRIEMFKSATELHRAGFQVTGYGYGSIWLNYPPGAAKDLIDLATEIGLDVPVSKFFEQRNETRLIKDE